MSLKARVLLFCLLLAGASLLCAGSAVAGPDGEIAELKRRVRQLEAQNREMMRALEELKRPVTARDGLTGSGSSNRHADASDASSGVPTAATMAGRGESSPAAHGSMVSAGGSRVRLYGFLRFDTIADSSLPDKAQTPFFVRSPDSASGGEANLTMHPRLTRLGLLLDGPQLGRLGGAHLGGKLEVDFQNGGRESRQVVRIRHAYLELRWPRLSLLAGQTWDVISPLYPTVNNDTLMWNAGNLGDRRPQLRFSYQRKAAAGRIDVTAALGLTDAVGAQDLDGDGVRDGERSLAPNLQARVGFRRALWSDDPGQLSAGLWGLQAFESTSSPVGGRTDFEGRAVGADLRLALSRRLLLHGEAWWGQNLDDFRGGVNQGINPTTGEEIESSGGWAELKFKWNSVYSTYGGYAIDDPRNGRVPDGGRTRNSAWHAGNRIRLGRPLLLGLDYLRWTTGYRGARSGRDDRVNAYVQYEF